MSKLAVILCVLASASAFVSPSAHNSLRKSNLVLQSSLNGWTPDESVSVFDIPLKQTHSSGFPQAFAYGLPGALDPVGDFDPAGFTERASLEEMKMYREAEVTHGRVSMLAVLGFLAQEQAHFLFVEPDKDIGPAIRHLDEVRAVNPIFFEGLGFVIACAELYRSLYGWASPFDADQFGTETTPGSLNDDYYPGDVGFDPFGIKPEDAEEFAEMATKELQHGRLAMLAVAGFFAQELTDGQTIVAKLSSLSG